MNKTRSKVMTIANRLVKQGLTRSIATVKAWIIVKANALRTKVKGTSRRQNALEKLAGVNPTDISVKLKREPSLQRFSREDWSTEAAVYNYRGFSQLRRNFLVNVRYHM